MSKKKFSNDLNSLFGFSTEVETFQDDNPLLNNEEDVATLVAPPKVAEKVAAKAEKKQVVIKRKKKKATKNFHSDLEDLFQEAFQEKMEEMRKEDAQPQQQTDQGGNSPEAAKKPKPRRIRKIRPRMGLDNLIRNTQNLSPEEIQVREDQKRVTFLYSKSQLEKLRNISRKDSRYMKDIIGEAVTQWLEEYKKSMES